MEKIENTSSAGTNRVVWFDLLNICACLCVVFLHHNGYVHWYVMDKPWLEALVVEVGAYWAVAVFLMLSGATLFTYRKRYTTKEFFKHRLLRTVIPFLLWTGICALIFSAWDMYTLPTDFRSVFDLFLNYRSNNLYWFFPTLFSLYLIFPLFAELADLGKRRLLWYCAGMIFVTHSLAAFLFPLAGLAWNPAYEFPLGAYCIFPILGYLLSTQPIRLRYRIALYAAGLLSAVARYVGVWQLSVRDSAKKVLFFDYTYVFSVLLACAVFVFFRYAWEFLSVRRSPFTPRVCRVLQEVSACSFGIYLIHYIVLTALLHWFPVFSPVQGIWRGVMPFATYGICFCIVFLIRKIPILRRVFP